MSGIDSDPFNISSTTIPKEKNPILQPVSSVNSATASLATASLATETLSKTSKKIPSAEEWTAVWSSFEELSTKISGIAKNTPNTCVMSVGSEDNWAKWEDAPDTKQPKILDTTNSTFSTPAQVTKPTETSSEGWATIWPDEKPIRPAQKLTLKIPASTPKGSSLPGRTKTPPVTTTAKKRNPFKAPQSLAVLSPKTPPVTPPTASASFTPVVKTQRQIFEELYAQGLAEVYSKNQFDLHAEDPWNVLYCTVSAAIFLDQYLRTGNCFIKYALEEGYRHYVHIVKPHLPRGELIANYEDILNALDIQDIRIFDGHLLLKESLDFRTQLRNKLDYIKGLMNLPNVIANNQNPSQIGAIFTITGSSYSFVIKKNANNTYTYIFYDSHGCASREHRGAYTLTFTGSDSDERFLEYLFSLHCGGGLFEMTPIYLPIRKESNFQSTHRA